MKKPRLNVIDINLMAKELRALFTNHVINTITAAGQQIIFELDNGQFSFMVLAGNPYLVLNTTTVHGHSRFRNLAGGRLENIAQVNSDRVLCLEIIAFNKLGIRKKQKLYLEFYGSGNIILSDENNIIRETFRNAASKQIGQAYELPEVSSANPLIVAKREDLPDELIDQLNKHNLFPFHSIGDDQTKLFELIKRAVKNPEPQILSDSEGNICGFSLLGPPFIEGVSGTGTKSLLEAVTQYAQANRVSPESSDNRDNFAVSLKKAQAKMKTMLDELAQTENAGLLRQYGEIILANLGSIKKGIKSYRCANPYSQEGDFIEIPLESARSPEKNAAAYFEKARRLESSVAIVKQRIINQQRKIEELQRQSEAPIPDDRELPRQPAVREKPAVKLPFRQVDLVDGWRVYIGKSDAANDELTFSFAKKDDLWFHAWQAAGSHVVLRRPNKGDIPSRDILTRAAELAAYNSKAKTSGKVPVIYTEIRYVRKVRGAAGKVTVTNEKQVMVKPTPPEKIIGE